VVVEIDAFAKEALADFVFGIPSRRRAGIGVLRHQHHCRGFVAQSFQGAAIVSLRSSPLRLAAGEYEVDVAIPRARRQALRLRRRLVSFTVTAGRAAAGVGVYAPEASLGGARGALLDRRLRRRSHHGRRPIDPREGSPWPNRPKASRSRSPTTSSGPLLQLLRITHTRDEFVARLHQPRAAGGTSSPARGDQPWSQ